MIDNLSAHEDRRVREIVEGGAASCCTCHPTHPISMP
jgi:hypothetical protein